MIVNLQPDDELVVKLENTAGEFRIHFGSKTYPNKLIVEETAGLADEKGRKAILYEETL